MNKYFIRSKISGKNKGNHDYSNSCVPNNEVFDVVLIWRLFYTADLRVFVYPKSDYL